MNALEASTGPPILETGRNVRMCGDSRDHGGHMQGRKPSPAAQPGRHLVGCGFRLPMIA